eukprot:CAMPEP_0118708206 /NCGR_PEP_ID=MMETSP0800-20121206/21728_1 /TAXON_ID=210618 ORGANISM="Striatella unipunctata, Strain CCMP2910" /NCGR_SAMPLE_ID=MMETSP0800 /ASSEMBLY_ACC=CAM_ASM_000638 /LENGTH=468 /DNA_ID=CAMNT_0006611313 /DNA_START=57 /DNA_END=1463 /DNA_ORIENTATION=-
MYLKTGAFDNRQRIDTWSTTDSLSSSESFRPQHDRAQIVFSTTTHQQAELFGENLADLEDEGDSIVFTSRSTSSKPPMLRSPRMTPRKKPQSSIPVRTDSKPSQLGKNHRRSMSDRHRNKGDAAHLMSRHRRKTSANSIDAIDLVYDQRMQDLRSRLAIMTDRGMSGTDIGKTWNQIGNLSFQKGEYNEAMESYRAALNCISNIGRSLSIEEQRNLATIKGSLGTTLWALGALDNASSCLADSLRINQRIAKALGNNVNKDLDVAKALYQLGLLQCLRRDFTSALQYLKKCESIQLDVLGSNSVEAARTMDAIGKVLLEVGNLDEALMCHEEALSVKQSVFGKRHASTVTSYLNLAAVHRVRAEYDTALNRLSSALSTQQYFLAMKNSSLQGPSSNQSHGSRASTALEVGMTLQMIAEVQELNKDEEASRESFAGALLMYKGAGLGKEDSRVQACTRRMYDDAAQTMM